MAVMSESFVDLSYRGLALGKRIKLTQVRPTTGVLEMPTPMPVGTAIGIATDDGVLLEATVAEVHEQVTGSDRAPGMMVRPKLDADAARTWWKQRVSMPELEKPTPQAAADGKVTVRSRRASNSDAGVPELVDDGRNTAVMSVIDDSAAAEVLIESSTDPSITNPSMPVQPLEDDGKRTMMMDAIDLAALGLDPSASSGSMPAVTDEDSGGTGNGNGDKSESKSKKKRKRR
jgi:hypothetical protein